MILKIKQILCANLTGVEIFELKNEMFQMIVNQINDVVQFSSVQSLSHVRLFVTPCIAARQGLPGYHQLPEFTQTHVH